MPRTNAYFPVGSDLPVWRPPRRMRPQFEQLPEEVKELLRDPVSFFCVFVSWNDEPMTFDGWQIAFLRSRHRFRAFAKSVQIGFSFLCAAEAFHRAFVWPDQDVLFASVSEEEAKNKVHYVGQLLDGLVPELRRAVTIPTHSKEQIHLGEGQETSRILSRAASSSMRGVAAHTYLDEIDHFRTGVDHEVYNAAIGRVTRANRRLTIGSSVFGEDTVLARIVASHRPGDGPTAYPDFLKVILPWWVAENEDQLSAIRAARANMPEDAFAQEYECRRTLVVDTLFPQDFLRECFHDRRVIPWQELPSEGNFCAGFDPGGSGHPAALTVLQMRENRWDQIVLERWRGKSLTEQQAYLEKLLNRCQGLTLSIDPGGLGKQMADYLVDTFGSRVVALPFTVKSKHDMALALRKQMESGSIRIARDQELAHELNRTRRVTGGKIEQPSMGKRAHYDSFWATAMASSVALGDSISIYDSQGLAYLDLDMVDV